jgi:hypothetical protein
MVISHYTKKTLNCFLKLQPSTTVGSNRGMFDIFVKLGFGNRFKQKKVSPNQALKNLEKYFK